MIHSDEDEDMQVDYDDDLGKVNLLQSHIKTLPHVLADGGSTHNVFNHAHRMLFISYRSVKPSLISGIIFIQQPPFFLQHDFNRN